MRIFTPLVTRVFAAAVFIAAGAVGASAQGTIGPVSWQLQPYCNVVTLTLYAGPSGFTLEGTDDLCGASNKGSAVGVASPNAAGEYTLNFTIVTAPAGKPVHVSAVVSPASGSGSWTDSVGNSGAFAFFGNSPGSPRPIPTSGVAPATITSVEIAPAAVGAAQIGANAVTGASVADGSLSSADLANGPRGAFTTPNPLVSLTTADVVVRSITITAPSAGTVLVNASGYFQFSDSAATGETGRCSITTGTSLDFSHLVIASDGASTIVTWAPWGATRGFSVGAGSLTVNLVCNRFSGTQNINVEDATLTALFVAQ